MLRLNEKYLVSACAAGRNCRYNGTNTFNPQIAQLVESGQALAFCPEEGGGLRAPCEIKGGDGHDVICGKAIVISKNGNDLTHDFIEGAQSALEFCREHGITTALLQKNSPSCGVGSIYDGTFTGKTITGDGVTAALLKQNGLVIKQIGEML